MDETFGYAQVFTGDTVPQPERRRFGLAVEPMTCPANALNSGEGLVVLEPGQRLTGTWGISPG
jgi:aldose 1-epimerase